MSGDEVLTNVLQDIVFMKTVGMMPILVHGGGPSYQPGNDEAGIAAEVCRRA